MSRYIDAEPKYIDANSLKQKWLFRGKDGKPYRDEIDAMPTADVVEVIPCKDCFYAKPYNKKWRLPINENLFWCEHHNEEKEPNWFCADAIERTVKK